MMWNWPNMMGGFYSGIGMILNFIFSIAIIVVIIILIVWLVRRAGHYHGESQGKALDILKERYAKGEITKEQYEEMKKNLGMS
ncbi:MAG: SHOCT domain-containing protein [Cyanobacteria bacterium]|nr:SHOCT domain-containing protein [Cyanobacteriota bacterium]